MSASKAAHARRLCEIGLVLVQTPPGVKGPRHAGWNDPTKAISEPRVAFDFWTANPAHGIAALLGPSRLVSLDIDDERAPEVLESLLGKFDLQGVPCIKGRGYRYLFRAPDVELRHRTLTWPKQDRPNESFVLFELRAGLVSDTLPPTRHPGTGRLYAWQSPPKDGFPELPKLLLKLWQDWRETSALIRSLCPWAPTPKVCRVQQRTQVDPSKSVIAAFNGAHDVAAILESHGYIRHGERRFAAPGTGHAAGVVLLSSGKVFCHHAGDPLFSERAHDAFDAYRLLQHQGDVCAAVRAAADSMGLGSRA